MRKNLHIRLLQLCAGQVTVSELSDKSISELLRYTIKRHSNAIGQLEQQKAQDDSELRFLSINSTTRDSLPKEK